ncbi:MAG: hypothetical protein ABIQ15_05570 [Nocardioides sp.]
MTTIRTLVTLPVAAGLLFLSAGAAQADPPPNFGQHVSVCAQTVGFSAQMNPSMHRGPSGWNGMTCPLP